MTWPPNVVQQNAARVTALEDQVARLNTSLQEMQRRPPDRHLLAALNLQAALQTSGPYQREWQALRDAAPAGARPAPFAEVLTSHATRGLATTTELRESFLLLAPTLSARTPEDQSWLDWGRLPRTDHPALLSYSGLVLEPDLEALGSRAFSDDRRLPNRRTLEIGA